MDGRRVLAFVLAGGRGSRLGPLCALHPKPALPLAGRRLMDFTLSNLVNSGVGEIYVLAQHRPRSIVEHVEEVWAPLLRRSGHVAGVILPPDAPDGVFLGTPDAYVAAQEDTLGPRPRFSIENAFWPIHGSRALV